MQADSKIRDRVSRIKKEVQREECWTQLVKIAKIEPLTSWSMQRLYQPTILFAKFLLLQCTTLLFPVMCGYAFVCWLYIYLKTQATVNSQSYNYCFIRSVTHGLTYDAHLLYYHAFWCFPLKHIMLHDHD